MSKVYDRVEWRFLLRTLRVMVFSTEFQDLMYQSICNIQYRVCVNRFYSGAFKSSRGVRQGGPLPLLLFIFAQQILSFNLNKHQNFGEVLPYILDRRVSQISHIFYVDDMLIFKNWRIRSLQRLKHLMSLYEDTSGQKINLQKSASYASKRIPQGLLTRIQRVSGCQIKILPFTYLVAQICQRRCRIDFFNEILEKFAYKIEGWHARFLSFGGKVTLIKVVLTGLPIHVFSCMAIPKHIQKRL